MDRNDVAALEARRPGAAPAPASRTPLRRRTAVILWVVLFVLWTTTGRVPYLHGLLFVVLGTCALLLASVAPAGWNVAGFRTVAAREAAARSAWASGALGTIVLFESALFGPSEGLAAVAYRLAISFMPALYGCAFAAGLLASMLRAMPDRLPPPRERPAVSTWDAWLGRILFVIVVAWPLVQARLSVKGPRLVGSVWMLHWPAVLVLLGTVAIMRLLGGSSLRRRAATPALAGAGAVTSLFGLVEALLGIARADVTVVAAGISFMVTACFLTLLGLALVTYPGDDLGVAHGNEPSVAARLAWVLFPLLTAGLMAVIFLMILTPMVRHA